MLALKNYQENAVVELKTEVNRLLDADGSKVCIFKSPTGSGKTLMAAEALKRIVDSRTDGKQLSFVWISVNKLHDQSKNKLKEYYDYLGAGLQCSHFQDLDDRKISENEILFLNWASINKKDNVYIRANEKDNNLSAVISRTKEEGRLIVLIIDESHHTASSSKSKELIQSIDPKVTIEVSATPQLNIANRIVEVDLRDVKDEGMVKKEIAINPGFEDLTVEKKKSDQAADDLVLEEALKKRQELKDKFEACHASVNPLLLIQIPDSRPGTESKRAEVEATLKKQGITTENGKLAVYLSEKDNQINLSNIEKPQNEVEVMIFKQAIALGWDCPRAAILVLFRQWKEENITFSIQTLGRIMRMPEHKHYSESSLNTGYVFTSLSDIKVAEDLSRDYITVFEGRRSGVYKNIDLQSWHAKRFREETRLSSDFTSVFFEAATELKLDKRVSKTHSIVDTKLITGKIEDSDNAKVEKTGALAIPKNETELQNAFDGFVRDNLAPFSPELRSIKRVNDSVYNFFGSRRNEDEWPKIQAMVLAEENRQPITDAINLAKEKYLAKVGVGKREVIENALPWNVPEIVNYDLSFTKRPYKKSIIQPYYARTSRSIGLATIEEDSDVEVRFIEFLEKSKSVLWWFKNGTKDGSYFAIPYEEHDQLHLFYPDFVLMTTGKRVGLFDTKSGITAQTAKAKAQALATYIASQNKKGKHLFGGIAIQDKGSWRYNDRRKYQYKAAYLKDWKFLDLS